MRQMQHTHASQCLMMETLEDAGDYRRWTGTEENTLERKHEASTRWRQVYRRYSGVE